MSRYDGREDTRSSEPHHGDYDRVIARLNSRDPRDDYEHALDRTVNLPKGDDRETVSFRGRDYELSGSETRTLATVGAFRVIAIDDLSHGRDEVRDADLRSLADQGLVEQKSVVLDRDKSSVVVLTRDGKDLLDAHQQRHDEHRQQFFCGLVKPREVAHDARLFAAYREEASRIDARGGRVERVVLDYELKREYQQYLNRPDRGDPPDLDEDRRTFATARDLPIIDGHLELPDLRIEYQDEEGRSVHRDIELVTEHYSRSQTAGKQRAGFFCHGRSARGRGASASRGGTPFDPRHTRG
jgi:hypothetical protein